MKRSGKSIRCVTWVSLVERKENVMDKTLTLTFTVARYSLDSRKRLREIYPSAFLRGSRILFSEDKRGREKTELERIIAARPEP
ncbi:hypothetical protein NPIL_180401 [Nephila pilipes]|uniref:Uncharacterized protein n=1 Tax=Nephila pilipes TaxID=299642 RepID=A0A8X6T9V2_NEPPI|nr:hypothetical protein NPIL_180401 [Nephila pilipes]